MTDLEKEIKEIITEIILNELNEEVLTEEAKPKDVKKED